MAAAEQVDDDIDELTAEEWAELRPLLQPVLRKLLRYVTQRRVDRPGVAKVEPAVVPTPEDFAELRARRRRRAHRHG